MEDSNTVHRRRKAAARRREKTPEPARRLSGIGILDNKQDQEAMDTADEEEERRVRMERMVEDTERMEEEFRK